MLTVRHYGMPATARFLGTACFAALLPQPLLSEAWKDNARLYNWSLHHKQHQG